MQRLRAVRLSPGHLANLDPCAICKELSVRGGVTSGTFIPRALQALGSCEQKRDTI